MIRVLDPATAVVTPRRDADGNAYVPKLRATAYVADQLLVRGQQLDSGIDRDVQSALGALGWSLEPEPAKRTPVPDRPFRRVPARDFPPRHFTPREQLPPLDVKLGSQRPQVFRIVVSGAGPTAPPDAWVALQTIAAVDGGRRAGDFELNHVLAATTLSGIGGYWSGIGGYWSGIGGYWSGIGGYWSGIGTSATPAEYGVPGLGGRSPVALIMADPALSAPRPARPPVVVMPDTGIGVHPWFRDLKATPVQFPPPLQHGVAVLGTPADIDDGVSDHLTGDLEHLAGHGTFIAGIVRQACPAARLESHAVMTAAGVMFEDELLDDLHALLERQVKALASGNAAAVVDVLTLSVGYYHEDGGDADDASIVGVLRDLGRVGVLVVAGAGNDATSEPMLPAGFAGPDPGDPGALPLISVGSLNPNGATVSLFSNAGTWVTTYRCGAAIVSTLPLNVNASVQASTRTGGGATAKDGLERSTIDRDDYSGGFGVWSGTSFATPVLAGQLAQALLDVGTDRIDLGSMRERGWTALERVVDGVRP